jgi:hypothetical protein
MGQDVQQWKKRSQASVTGQSGLKYTVRAVSLAELTGIWGALPEFLPGPEAKSKGDARTDAWRALLTKPDGMLAVQKIVSAGVIDPVIGDGPDQVAISEIPALDLFACLTRIIELSGLTDKEAKALRPT